MTDKRISSGYKFGHGPKPTEINPEILEAAQIHFQKLISEMPVIANDAPAYGGQRVAPLEE